MVALPFHFFFALTGLIIFAGIYFPVSETHAASRWREAHAEAEAAAHRPAASSRAGVAAPLASVDAMVAEAKRRWAARGMAGRGRASCTVNHVGDANGYVSIYRAGTDRVALVGQGMHFKAPTGERDPRGAAADRGRRASTSSSPACTCSTSGTGCCAGSTCWAGLPGCVCIATGFIFFVEKRKRQHAAAGHAAARAGSMRWPSPR